MREDRLRNLQRLLIDDELRHARTLPQFAKIRHEVAQPERGVDVFRIERSKDDVRHGLAYWPNQPVTANGNESR